MRYSLLLLLSCGVLGLMGCGSTAPPVAMAPPVNGGGQMMPSGQQMMGGGGQGMAPQGDSVYQWQDVPQGQQVPVNVARFDQGGYQMYAASGETIVVPFANQNLYVMKFGRSNTGQTFFVNEGDAPCLYLPNGGYVENAAAQNARWYPIPQDYNYTRPMYVSLAPSWAEYTAMGWYPGMTMYGGMWGYHPRATFAWMPNFYVSIGGHRYNDYVSYHTYYNSNPGYIRNRVVYNNYTTRSSGTFGTSRSYGSSGTMGRSRFGGNSVGSSGSFGTGRRSSGFSGSPSSSSSFSSGRRSSGFGNSGASSGSMGGNSGGAFGNSQRSSGSSFSGTRSFGNGDSSFNGGRLSGGSSSGGSSFGRSRSGGGSFGGRRR